MKKIGLLILALLILPLVVAINVDVTDKSNNLMVVGSNQPIIANISIKNNGEDSNFNIYNLLGFEMEVPQFHLNRGEQKEISMKIYPREKMTMRGVYALEYTIRADDNSETSNALSIRVIEPKDAFEVGAEDISLEANTFTVYIQNKENFDFKEVNAKISSDFFQFDKTFAIGPKGKQTFKLDLNNEDIKKLVAGFYTIKAEINSLGQTGVTEGKVKFVEKDSVETTKDEKGLFINTQTVEKINKGNTIVKPEVTIEKNVLTRFFTSTEPKADVIERNGFNVEYTWIKEIKPSETMKVEVTTNWFFPIILTLLIILIIYLVIKFTRTDVIVRKRVNYVKTRGGEFALKVTIFVKAKNYIERLNLIDRVPFLVKVYPRFGGEQPTKVDEQRKRIDWRFEKMEAGEIRRITYVIYSKVGVLGRFALPKAKAVYEKNGQVKEVKSNKTYFVTRKDSVD